MIKAKQIHCGQYRRYDDFYRVWEIETDEPQEKVLEYCFSELHKRKVPEYGEWHHAVKFGGERDGDMAYYFAGYYRLEEIESGYKFTVCEPYCD